MTKKKCTRTDERNEEMVAFFYMILSHRIRSGMDAEEARKEAYDAVSLRYDISRGRFLNIVSEQNSSRRANILSLRRKAESIINDLYVVNAEFDRAKEKNNRLIDLLNECIEDDGR